MLIAEWYCNMHPLLSMTKAKSPTFLSHSHYFFDIKLPQPNIYLYSALFSPSLLPFSVSCTLFAVVVWLSLSLYVLVIQFHAFIKQIEVHPSLGTLTKPTKNTLHLQSLIMAAVNCLSCLHFFLLSFHCLCISGKWQAQGLQIVKQHTLPTSGTKRLKLGRKLDVFMPTTTNPANPQPYTTTTNPTPTIITVPGSNPTATATTPTTTVPTTPTVNPAATDPGLVGGSPVVAGQTWCIARTGAPESSLQSALDYACGMGGVDCSVIQDGGSCFNPNTLENHASYAFNTYFQRNPVPASCDFGGTAVMVNTDPSSGTCVYPSSSGGMTAMPASTIPPLTPTNVPTSSSYPPATPTDFPPATTTSPGGTATPYGVPASGALDSPPSYSGSDSPGVLGYGNGGPPTSSSSNSMPAGSVVAAASQPLVGFINLVVFFIAGILILGA